MNGDTKYLTAIRGFACIVVVLAHIIAAVPGVGANVSGCGKIGVWLFFILSAFLLTIQWINKPQMNLKEVMKFYIKRFFRIFPCYVIVLIISFLIGYITSAETVVKHIFLLEGIGHFWTIPVEFIFYLMVPVFMFVIKKINNLKKSVLLLTILSIATAIIWPYYKCEENSIDVWWYLPVFFMGMITAFLYQYFEDKPVKSGVWDFTICVIALGMACAVPYVRNLLFHIEPDPYLQNKYLYFGLAWSIVILAIQNSRYVKEILNRSKVLLSLGNISFPLYLVHYIVLNQLKIENSLINSVAVFLISIILAVIMNRLVEQPMIKVCKNINNKIFKEVKDKCQNSKELTPQ